MLSSGYILVPKLLLGNPFGRKTLFCSESAYPTLYSCQAELGLHLRPQAGAWGREEKLALAAADLPF
jgi:hypothetical protein